MPIASEGEGVRSKIYLALLGQLVIFIHFCTTVCAFGCEHVPVLLSRCRKIP